MTRSMTLIKMYFVNAVRQLGAEVYKKIYDRVSYAVLIDCFHADDHSSLSSPKPLSWL